MSTVSLKARRPSRRTFLLGLGLGGAAAAGWAIARGGRATSGASASLPATLQAAEQRTCALGTEMSIIALHESADHARRAIAAAFAAVEHVEQVMSLYRADSQLSRLNASGALDDPDPDLVAVLKHAADVSRASGGAFDVTVQRLWTLYDTAHRRGELPDDAQILAARQSVDFRKLTVTDRQLRLPRGMAVTLNGIAQGFAADRLLAVLRDHGIQHALVNAGEIAVVGCKQASKPWTVGIQHPRRPNAYLALAALDGRCLSTSGDYATAFTDDRLYHHIFDPSTGRSPTVFSSVTVVAPTATQADALSTAIFVLGTDKGLELAKATPQTDVLLVLKDGQTLATAGFPQVSA